MQLCFSHHLLHPRPFGVASYLLLRLLPLPLCLRLRSVSLEVFQFNDVAVRHHGVMNEVGHILSRQSIPTQILVEPFSLLPMMCFAKLFFTFLCCIIEYFALSLLTHYSMHTSHVKHAPFVCALHQGKASHDALSNGCLKPRKFHMHTKDKCGV